ncbi:MAG: DUF1080 domain-containing protein [Bryobacterales bacterium]|nr:DUF1080 domain-containing protein [Bryobacterales bacterium]
MKRLVSVLLLGIAISWAQTPSALESDPRGWQDIMPPPSLQGWARAPFMTTDPLNPQSQWKVDPSGLLVCEGDKGHEFFYLNRELANFIFHAEWRFVPIPNGKGYNSGVMARNSIDGKIWHQGQTGDASGGFLMGATPVKGEIQRINTRAQLKENRVKPAGEWNIFEIRADGPKMTLWVNGDVTAVVDNLEVMRGYIGLEAEGYLIQFRNLKLKELP